MSFEIKDVQYEMTGGGCFTFWGILNNGEWFCYSTAGEVLSFFDADIYEAMNKELYCDDEDWDAYEWEQVHTIRSYEEESKEKKVFLKDMFEWLVKNLPNDSTVKVLTRNIV